MSRLTPTLEFVDVLVQRYSPTSGSHPDGTTITYRPSPFWQTGDMIPMGYLKPDVVTSYIVGE